MAHIVFKKVTSSVLGTWFATTAPQPVVTFGTWFVTTAPQPKNKDIGLKFCEHVVRVSPYNIHSVFNSKILDFLAIFFKNQNLTFI